MKIVVTGRNGTRDFECGADEKILHAALRHEIELPYECATGTCGTCKAKLVSGTIDSQWADAPGKKYFRAENEFLTCQSHAREDCALEVFALKEREPESAAPRALAGVIRDVRRLTHDVVAFDVDVDAPLEFDAGQFALLTVPGIVGARAYSMVNYARGAARLAFVVKKKPGGAVSEWLFAERIDGVRVGLVAPLGHATFRPDARKHVLCIAGGSGIAGMMSILARACEANHFRDWDGHVFFGVRTGRDAFYFDELQAFQATAPRLAVTIALSDEDVTPALTDAYPTFTFGRGFVHAVAGEAMKDRFADVRAYVAGPPPAVDAAIRMLLLEAKLTTDNIRYDKYS